MADFVRYLREAANKNITISIFSEDIKLNLHLKSVSLEDDEILVEEGQIEPNLTTVSEIYEDEEGIHIEYPTLSLGITAL